MANERYNTFYGGKIETTDKGYGVEVVLKLDCGFDIVYKVNNNTGSGSLEVFSDEIVKPIFAVDIADTRADKGVPTFKAEVPKRTPFSMFSDDEVALDETDTEALADFFWEATEDDASGAGDKFAELITQYQNMTSDGKKIINMVLVSLCGWQLPTMRGQSQL
jgi:hypothetical protein